MIAVIVCVHGLGPRFDKHRNPVPSPKDVQGRVSASEWISCGFSAVGISQEPDQQHSPKTTRDPVGPAAKRSTSDRHP